MTSPLIDRSSSILLFGRDHRLVETRQWVLEREGFRVHTALGLTELRTIAAKHEIVLFLLCDSLRSGERTEALALIQASWQEAKRLVLAPAWELTDETPPAEEMFPAREGPRGLVAMVRRLMVAPPMLAV
jgi:hypothetical protein